MDELSRILTNPQTPEEKRLAHLNAAVQLQDLEFRNKYRILEIVTFNTHPQKPLGQFCHDMIKLMWTEISHTPDAFKDVDEDKETKESDLNVEYQMLHEVYENSADMTQRETTEENDPIMKELMKDKFPPVRENDDKLSVFLENIIFKRMAIENARVNAGLDTDIKPEW